MLPFQNHNTCFTLYVISKTSKEFVHFITAKNVYAFKDLFDAQLVIVTNFAAI